MPVQLLFSERHRFAFAALKHAPEFIDVLRPQSYPFAALLTAVAAASTLQQPLIVAAQVNAVRGGW